MKLLKKIISYLRFCSLIINKKINLKGFVYLHSRVKIIIEKDAKLNLGKNVVIKNDTIIFVKKGATLIIGNGSSIGHHSEITCGKSISIGANVIMGAYIYITDSNHKFSDPTVLIKNQGIETRKVAIGNDVWVGRGTNILPGCILGDRIVIAAGAVVTKRFAGSSILGGVPAKIIKDI